MNISISYKIIVFAIISFILASCASRKSVVMQQSHTMQNDVVDYAKKHLNAPYRLSGKGPNAFDCSGYTSFVFKKFGYNLGSSSAAQANQGTTIKNKKELKIGDLVFFEGRRRNGRVGHVGIVSEIGRGGRFKFIHSSTSNGVIITSSEEPYYRARYLHGSRLIEEKVKVVEREKELQESKTGPRHLHAHNDIVYKETKDGFIAINKITKEPTEGQNRVIVESDTYSKTTQKSNKQEEKREKLRQPIIATVESSSASPRSRINHKVRPGETLFSISKQYNCSIEQLQKWNPEVENISIKAGYNLYIYQ